MPDSQELDFMGEDPYREVVGGVIVELHGIFHVQFSGTKS